MEFIEIERDILESKKSWDLFRSYLYKELSFIKGEISKIEADIKKIETVIKIEKYNDNGLLLKYKNPIISIDSSLERHFKIAGYFVNLNNEENDLCKEAFKVIRERIRTFNEKLEIYNSDLIKESKNYSDVYDLFMGVVTDFHLIVKLCEKYNMDREVMRKILLYPMYKASKPNVVRKPKEVKQIEEKEEIKEEKEEVIEIVEINYKTEFLVVKEKYNKINVEMNDLLNKYYNMLSEMSKELQNSYHGYAKALDKFSTEELKAIFDGQSYEDALAKVVAFKLFDYKSGLEEKILKISSDGYKDKEDIDFLELCIDEEYTLLCNKLRELDKQITENKKEENEFVFSKAYFLPDENNEPMISPLIKEDNLVNNLMNLLEKAENEMIQRKKTSVRIMSGSKKFKEKSGKDIFTTINSKIIISFVKLRDNSILILYAEEFKNNKINENTSRIIKSYEEAILKLITALENQDSMTVLSQSEIIKSLMKESDYKWKKN